MLLMSLSGMLKVLDDEGAYYREMFIGIAAGADSES